MKWKLRFQFPIFAMALMSLGCRWLPPFDPPGTKEALRGRAVLHDPYPNNDVGPAIMGGRPLGFERPLSEAEANQYARSRGATPATYQGF